MEKEGDSSFQTNDFGTRLRDIDERNKLIRERVLLLGKNLIDVRKDLSDDINELRSESNQLRKELDNLKKVSKSLLTDFNSFVKRDEIMVIERMLKDFQPLDFLRRKDVEELIEKKIVESKKQIKTSLTKK